MLTLTDKQLDGCRNGLRITRSAQGRVAAGGQAPRQATRQVLPLRAVVEQPEDARKVMGSVTESGLWSPGSGQAVTQ